MSKNARALAAQVVADVLSGRSLNQALPRQQRKAQERDRALVQQLSYGCLRIAPRLEGLLAQLLDKPLREKDRDIHSLLLIGLYQLNDTRIPEHAAVAETVSAVGVLKKSWARGLTNAILRRFIREKDDLIAALDDAQAAALPPWLYQRIMQQWPENAQNIFNANNTQPPMTLRNNTQQQDSAAYLQRLGEVGIAAHMGAISNEAIYLEEGADVLSLPGFAAGSVSVQDEAAQLAASLLQVSPGMRVLDACAAPGGKTCHLLEVEPAIAELIAMDSDAERLQRITQNLQRLKLDATVLHGDAARPPGALAVSSFDRIMIDAPCSASGVLRRHPDIRCLRRESDIAQFTQKQFEILCGLWPLLKPNGLALYITCSLLAEENTDVISRFTDTESTAETVPIEQPWGLPSGPGRQLLPTLNTHDGLFYCLLRKLG